MMNKPSAKMTSKSKDQKISLLIDQIDQTSSSINQTRLSKDNHVNQGLNDQCYPQICKKCVELQLKIKQLEIIIQKMGSNHNQNLPNSNKEIHSPIREANTNNVSKDLSTPRLRYTFGVNDVVLESQEKLLHDIEQRAIQLRKKEKKKTEIIKKIAHKSLRGDISEPVHNSYDIKSYQKEKIQHNASLDLSKSQLSLIKQKVSQEVQITNSQSLLQETLLEQAVENKKQQINILGIPLNDIPQKETQLPALPNDNSFENEEIEAILDSRTSKANTSKAEEEISYNSNLKSSTISFSSKEKVADMSPQEAEEHYKNQMRKFSCGLFVSKKCFSHSDQQKFQNRQEIFRKKDRGPCSFQVEQVFDKERLCFSQLCMEVYLQLLLYYIFKKRIGKSILTMPISLVCTVWLFCRSCSIYHAQKININNGKYSFICIFQNSNKSFLQRQLFEFFCLFFLQEIDKNFQMHQNPAFAQR